MTRCHRYEGVHIPGCWPCVLYGGQYPGEHAADMCLCRPVNRTWVEPEDDMDVWMDKIEQRIAALEARG